MHEFLRDVHTTKCSHAWEVRGARRPRDVSLPLFGQLCPRKAAPGSPKRGLHVSRRQRCADAPGPQPRRGRAQHGLAKVVSEHTEAALGGRTWGKWDGRGSEEATGSVVPPETTLYGPRCGETALRASDAGDSGEKPCPSCCGPSSASGLHSWGPATPGHPALTAVRSS